ncbi:hypothetical protein I0C86_24285, partial [Plantactinospora sp. S1510]
ARGPAPSGGSGSSAGAGGDNTGTGGDQHGGGPADGGAPGKGAADGVGTAVDGGGGTGGQPAAGSDVRPAGSDGEASRAGSGDTSIQTSDTPATTDKSDTAPPGGSVGEPARDAARDAPAPTGTPGAVTRGSDAAHPTAVPEPGRVETPLNPAAEFRPEAVTAGAPSTKDISETRESVPASVAEQPPQSIRPDLPAAGEGSVDQTAEPAATPDQTDLQTVESVGGDAPTDSTSRQSPAAAGPDGPEETPGTRRDTEPSLPVNRVAAAPSTIPAGSAPPSTSTGTSTDRFANAYLAAQGSGAVNFAIPVPTDVMAANGSAAAKLDQTFRDAGLKPLSETGKPDIAADRATTDLRTGLNRKADDVGLKQGIFPATDEAAAAPARRTDVSTAGAPDRFTPPGFHSVERANSPVMRLEDALTAQGCTPREIQGLREAIRQDPALADRLGGKQGAELWRDFAKVGQVPWDRLRPPSERVDALLHRALGLDADGYVSQKNLDQLTHRAWHDEKSLLGRGLSQSDMQALRGYLRETGRSPKPAAEDRLVLAGDGQTMRESEYVQHERTKQIHATVEAPIAVGVARAAGASPETAAKIGQASNLVVDMVSAAVPHIAAQRDLHTSTNLPNQERAAVVRPQSPAVDTKPPATDIPAEAPQPGRSTARDGGVRLSGDTGCAATRTPVDRTPTTRPSTAAPADRTAPTGQSPGRAPDLKLNTPPLDTRATTTGGIEKISTAVDHFGARTVVIEGKVLEGIKDRALNAPNYNRESHWRDLRAELNVPNYEAAHLWGPGFGDEAAAGIMLAPRDVNQIWQSKGVEAFVRDLANEARVHGGALRLTATATSHGSEVRGGDALLAQVTYRFTVVDRTGNPVDAKQVTLSVDPPPSGRVHDLAVSDVPLRRSRP